uniref:Uncharacterized protein n=1 Tax=Anguilla anguilla TaxID=7936 RepID=A0A0E9S6P0_ANGAN
MAEFSLAHIAHSNDSEDADVWMSDFQSTEVGKTTSRSYCPGSIKL